MDRKIIRLGESTLVVSLPSKWVKANKLDAGARLIVEENGPEITFSSNQEISHKTLKIHIASAKEYMGRLVHNPYRFGYSRLEVSFDDPTVLPLIRKHLDQLLGFEIVDQTERSCVIEMVASEREEEFDKMLRRAMTILQGMLDDGVRAFESNDKDLFNDVAQREPTIDKLTNFCLRVLNSRIGEPGKSHYHSMLVWSLERIGDDVQNVAQWLISAKVTASQRKNAHTSLKLWAEAFRSFILFFAQPSQKAMLHSKAGIKKGRDSIPDLPPELAGPMYASFEALDNLYVWFPE